MTKTENEIVDEQISFEDAVKMMVDGQLLDPENPEKSHEKRLFLVSIIEGIFNQVQISELSENIGWQTEQERKQLGENKTLFDLEKKLRKKDLDCWWSFRRFCKDALAIYETVEELKKENEDYIEPSAEYIILEFWEVFRLGQLFWRKIFHSDDAKNGVDAKLIFLNEIELFFWPKFSDRVLHGNKRQGYYANAQLNFGQMDKYLGSALFVAERSELLSFALLYFRIGAETWAYHCDCMNSISHKDGYVATSGEIKLAEKNFYSFNKIQSDRAMAIVKRTWILIGSTVTISAGLFGGGVLLNEPNLSLIGTILFLIPLSLFIWFLAVWLFKVVFKFLFSVDGNYKIFEKTETRKEIARKRLYLLSQQFDRFDVDLEGCVVDVRQAIKENMALPSVLIAILKSQLVQGVYHLDEYTIFNKK